MSRFSDYTEINFKFEELGLAAFKTFGKANDPYGYAAQDSYSYYFASEIKTNGRRALSCFLQKIIGDNFNYKKMRTEQNPIITKLLQLENDVWEARTQHDIIQIILDSIEQVKKLGY